MEKIKFSIIIATYNRSELLRKAIKSVINQDYKNFEIIVVDDGGTDNTKEVVDSFSNKKIKYFWKENEERSIARNFGISKATGEYVGFLDSDDYYLPNHFLEASKLISGEFPPIVCLGSEYRTFHDRTVSIQNKWRGNIRSRILKTSFINSNAILIRSEILKKYQFIHHRDAVYSEDWYLWIRLAIRFPIKLSNEITSVVCEHEDRSLNTLDPSKVEKSIILVIKNLLDDDEFVKLGWKKIGGILFELYSSAALVFLENRLTSKSKKYLIIALKEYPLGFFRKRTLALLKSYLF